MEEKNIWQYFVETYTKNYANFEGRARRKEFWGFYLFYMIFYLGLGAITTSSESLMWIPLIFVLASLIPYLGVAVRRMHDTNHSGWFILIPIYNLILMLTNGDKGPNKYGVDPKNPDMGSEIEQIGEE